MPCTPAGARRRAERRRASRSPASSAISPPYLVLTVLTCSVVILITHIMWRRKWEEWPLLRLSRHLGKDSLAAGISEVLIPKRVIQRVQPGLDLLGQSLLRLRRILRRTVHRLA